MERKAGPEKGSPPQSSSSSSSTTSLLSTPSFLSQGSIASRILSSPSLSYPPPLKLSSTPGAGGSLTASPLSSSAAAAGLLGVPGGSGHSQFEPVSPDEDEKPASEGMWHRLMYRRSGNFHVKKLSYDKFSCKNIFV